MSETNDVIPETEFNPESIEKPVVSADSAKAAGLSCDKGIIVLLLIGLLALLLALYAVYESRHARAGMTRDNQTLNRRVAELNQQVTAQINWQTKQQSLLDRQQQQLGEFNKQLQTALHQRLYQKQDWLLYKARYYLELAQINSHWSDNQQTTIALLHEADSILQAISDQSVFVVRQSIAQEMSQLKALPTIDVAGILSQLDSARQAVNDLVLKDGNNNAAEPTSTTDANNTSSWRSGLHRSVNFLKTLVVVRHQETDIQPLLSPLHQAMIRESLRMDLQQAQWAVLQHNDPVFQQTLHQALQEIAQYLDSEASNTQALTTQLQALQKQPLTQKNPMIDQSLQQLNDIIDTKNTPVVPANGGDLQ